MMKRARKHVVDILVVLVCVPIAIYIGWANGLELALVFSSIPVAFLTAKWFGDVAGAKAAREYEEQKTAQARITALRSLLNEVARIRKLVEINSQIDDSGLGMVRMPTVAFETAFVSKPSGLPVAPELLDTVVDYLACADAINSRIDTYLGLGAALGQSQYAGGIWGDAVRQVRDRSKPISEILDRLDRLLEHELETNPVCNAAAA